MQKCMQKFPQAINNEGNTSDRYLINDHCIVSGRQITHCECVWIDDNGFTREWPNLMWSKHWLPDITSSWIRGRHRYLWDACTRSDLTCTITFPRCLGPLRLYCPTRCKGFLLRDIIGHYCPVALRGCNKCDK